MTIGDSIALSTTVLTVGSALIVAMLKYSPRSRAKKNTDDDNSNLQRAIHTVLVQIAEDLHGIVGVQSQLKHISEQLQNIFLRLTAIETGQAVGAADSKHYAEKVNKMERHLEGRGRDE